MARYEKASWSTGSGTVKEFALDTAKLRVKILEEEKAKLEQGQAHYHQTAIKWKSEAMK